MMLYPTTKKIAGLIILVVLILPTIFYPSKARADSNIISHTVCAAYTATIGQLIQAGKDYLQGLVGGLIGGFIHQGTSQVTNQLNITAVPVTDVTTQAAVTDVRSQSAANTAALNTKSDEQACEDFVNNVALAALKKRLIDTMTDEIITWINGGGSPKFITNFGQEVFQPALNQAVGDTVQQIMPSLCSPYSFNVSLALTAPQPLSQPSNCTLNSIVANFNDFRKNFNIGGAIGYSELLQPQNNQYGVDILTQDALYNNVQTQTAKDTLQTQVNVGFKVNQCGGWQLINKNTNALIASGVTINPTDSNNIPLFGSYTNPDNPPPTDYSHVYAGTGGDSVTTAALINNNTAGWQCSKIEVATPGRAIAEGLNKALYANLDLTINDPDITNALAMIADAAFNRLIKAGTNLIQTSLSKTSGGGSSVGTTPEQVVNNAQSSNSSGSLGEAINNIDTIKNQITSGGNNALQNTYITNLNAAINFLNDASTTLVTASSTNTTLASSTLELIDCLVLKNSSSSDLAWAQGNLTIAVSSTPPLIDQTMTQVASSSVTVNTFLSTLNSPNLTPDTLKNINPADISGLLTNASDLDNQAQTILSNVQATLETTQTKINQCQARS